MNKDNEKAVREIATLSEEFLNKIIPIMDNYSPAVVCYSFIKYIAATCLAQRELKNIKLMGHEFEGIKDFFHSQLDGIYEDMKGKSGGQIYK